MGPYELAKVLLERGELLLDTDRRAEGVAFIDEARTLLEQALAGRPASAA